VLVSKTVHFGKHSPPHLQARFRIRSPANTGNAAKKGRLGKTGKNSRLNNSSGLAYHAGKTGPSWE
jgi:hypothetical protein